MKHIVGLLVMSSVIWTGIAQSANADQNSRVYDVTHVNADDTLNLRAGAGVQHPVLAQIPANGKGVVATGEHQTIGESVWSRVVWAGVDGWVNRRYLREDRLIAKARQAATEKKVEATKKRQSQTILACHGVKPNWRIDISSRAMNVAFNGKLRYQALVHFRQQSANNKAIAVIAGKRNETNTTVLLQKTNACKVGDIRRPYAYSMTAVLDDRQVVSGCCQVLTQ